MKIIRRLLPYFREHLGLWLLSFAAMAVVAGVTGGSMWLLKKVIDEALTAKDISALQNIVFLVVALYLIKAVLSYVHDFATAYIGQAIIRKIRDQVFAHLHSLSMDFFTANDSARIISRLTNDAQLLQNALNKIPIMIVRDGLTIIGLIGFLIYLHWKFALMTFLLLPVCGILIARFGKSLRKSARAGQAKMSDLYLTIQETIVGAPVVKSFLREDFEKQRFVRENKDYFDITLKNARVESLSSPVMEFLGALALSVLLWMGGQDVVDGKWTTGAFFAFIGSALSMYQPVKNFSRSNATLQQALAAGERIFALMDTPSSIREKPGAGTLERFAQKIQFQDVSFAYRSDRPVLRNVELTVNKGEVVALVGPSGSGKSTLSYLLLRFYDPTGGSVLFDGKDIRDMTLDSLRGQMGLVTQETLLFNNTVRYNILYGRNDATEAEIIAAAKSANAWEFIEKLPQGLDTMIGERGILLSGGQKQRLAIARAILKNPPILILDEATSALDAASEKLVQDAVEKLLENRTVLVIAHRLATVKKASRIVVVDHGRIVETGTHAELLAVKGLYSKLYELQLLESETV